MKLHLFRTNPLICCMHNRILSASKTRSYQNITWVCVIHSWYVLHQFPSVFHYWQHNPIKQNEGVELIMELSKAWESCPLIMTCVQKVHCNSQYMIILTNKLSIYPQCIQYWILLEHGPIQNNTVCSIPVTNAINNHLLGPLLLTWFNLIPGMYK